VTTRELTALASALVPLGVAIMEHQSRVEAEAVTKDVIRAVSASLEEYDPCVTE